MPNKYEIDRDRERGTGIFHVYWRETVKGKNRPKRASLGTKDEAEKDVAFTKFLLKRGEKVDAAAQNGIIYTISHLWEIYMEHLLKGRSWKQARQRWTHVLGPHFGHLTVPEVTNTVVQDYVRKRLSGKLRCPGSNGRGVSVTEGSVRGELIMLTSCMNHASLRRHGHQLFNPALIPAFTLPDESAPRDRALEPHEIDALHDAAASVSTDGKLTRIEIFLHLALGTAGRVEAIRTLTFDPKRVNFEKRFIDLNDGQRLKGDKKRARVYMNDTLHAVLKRALAESDQSIPLEKRYVLGHSGTVWPAMQLVVYKAGLAPEGYRPSKIGNPKSTGISPHVLRHTAATHMVAAGIPIAHVADFLGNSPEMVNKVYKHLKPDHLKDAADVMNRGFRVVKQREVA